MLSQGTPGPTSRAGTGWAQGSLEWRAPFLVSTCSLLPSPKPLTRPLPDPGWAYLGPLSAA